MQLTFGHRVPEGVETAWGARLIAPADLLRDRQDLRSANDTAKAALFDWLDGSNGGDGAIAQLLAGLRVGYRLLVQDEESVLFEDARGVIIGRSAGGYVYVTGYLRPEADHCDALDETTYEEFADCTQCGTRVFPLPMTRRADVDAQGRCGDCQWDGDVDPAPVSIDEFTRACADVLPC